MAAPNAESLKPMIEQAKLSIVTIRAGNKNIGSGVVIAPDLVVTNYHVINGQKNISIAHGEIPHGVTILRGNAAHDVCLIRCPGLTAPVAKLGRSRGLALGEPVAAIGAPQGRVIDSAGTLQHFNRADDIPLLMSSCRTSHGWSGGGLFNQKGELVGITAYQAGSGALPVEWVNELLNSRDAGFMANNDPPKTEIDWYNKSDKQNYEVMREWVKQRPESYFAQFSLGAAGLMATDPAYKKESIAALQKAIGIFPEDATASMFIGDLYRQLKENNKAVNAYRQAFQIDPANPIYMHEAGNLLHDMGKYDEAVKAYETAHHIKPSENIWLAIASVHRDSGNRAQAAKAYKNAFELTPRGRDNYYELAENCRIARCYKAAEQACRKGLKAFPDYVPLIDQLASLYEEQGEHTKAEKSRALADELFRKKER